LGIGGCSFKWLTIPAFMLRDHYSGKKEELDVYIQSHALRRLQERLDLLSKEAICHSLWQNTVDIMYMCSYKGYLYLPFTLYDVKVGYLVANIVDDCILFRSFIFMTHNSTPEGDKLRKLSGLGYTDISYWKIDRLSTFVNIDKDKQSDLLNLFAEAGMDGLDCLIEKDFGIESLEAANLDKLMDYIRKGKNREKVQKEDFEALIRDEEKELV